MRQNKFANALMLTPEQGLATETQAALRGFGLKKLHVVTEFAELQKQVMEHSFQLILVDTDCLEGIDRNDLVNRIRSMKDHSQGIFVAIAHIESRDQLTELKQQGYSTVLIKPISKGMMEQALSEVIERERQLPIDRDALLEVHALFLRGGLFEAERTLAIWLEKEPDSLEGLTLLALHQLKKQEFYRANATINKVFRIKDDFLPALQLRTRIALRLGQLSDAYQSLAKEEKAVARLEAKRAVGQGPGLSKSDIAEITFSEEFDTRDGVTTLLINLALQLSKTGRPDDSIGLYKRALGPLEDPDARFVTLFNRGRLYLNQRQATEAKIDLLAAKEICPEELYPKIDELILLCDSTSTKSAIEDLQPSPKKRSGASISPDLLDEENNQSKKPKYRTFNKDEVLELVFLGKMQESTIPPESVAEWLQIKKKLLHILFLEVLPLLDEENGSGDDRTGESGVEAGQGAT
ncbi:response regulator [bacterium]|nr:response regulator [bacterium]